tara:strand:+ start:1873 stop:3660 length:1788 start_codon:yes stop_codon:yes gene_type:complete
MAIPLPKYKSQVRVSGEGVAKPLDPTATIKAAGAEDALLADFITQAGGVASDFFEEKAKTVDKGLLADYEREKLETDARIITRSQDALLGRGEFEGNPLSYDQISETVVQDELNKLQGSLSEKNFNFNDNRLRADNDFVNYENKINTQQLVAINQREIEQSNLSQFNLLEGKVIMLDSLQLDYEKLNPASPEAIALKQQIDDLSLDIEEGYTDLERTTKPGTVQSTRQRNASSLYSTKIDLLYSNYTVEALNPYEFQESIKDLKERIEKDKVLDATQKSKLFENISLKENAVNRKATQARRETDIAFSLLLSQNEAVNPRDIDTLRAKYEPYLGKDGFDSIILRSFDSLNPSNDQRKKLDESLVKFSSTGDFLTLIEDIVKVFDVDIKGKGNKGALYANYIREFATVMWEDWIAASGNSDDAYNRAAVMLGIAPLPEGEDPENYRVDLSKSFQYKIIRESIEMAEDFQTFDPEGFKAYESSVQDAFKQIIDFSNKFDANNRPKVEDIRELRNQVNGGIASKLVEVISTPTPTPVENNETEFTISLVYNNPTQFAEEYAKLPPGSYYKDANGNIREKDTTSINKDPIKQSRNVGTK